VYRLDLYLLWLLEYLKHSGNVLPKNPKHELNHTDCLTMGCYLLQRVNIPIPGGTIRYSTIIRNAGAYVASVTSYNKARIIFISPSSSNLA